MCTLTEENYNMCNAQMHPISRLMQDIFLLCVSEYDVLINKFTVSQAIDYTKWKTLVIALKNLSTCNIKLTST